MVNISQVYGWIFISKDKFPLKYLSPGHFFDLWILILIRTKKKHVLFIPGFMGSSRWCKSDISGKAQIHQRRPFQNNPWRQQHWMGLSHPIPEKIRRSMSCSSHVFTNPKFSICNCFFEKKFVFSIKVTVILVFYNLFWFLNENYI